MKVIVSNHKQPIYGQVTVPLPIPDEEYDHVIELLEALEIGDFRAWDCHVNKICDCPPVLKRLEGTQINIDELDYLAKRLDSFVPKELAAFQGMVEKMDYTEVFDMINLSFYCDEITVITDFKDTAAIGRNHVLAKNGATDAPRRRLQAGRDRTAYPQALRVARSPFGHAEGFRVSDQDSRN